MGMNLFRFLGVALPLCIAICGCHDNGKLSPTPQARTASDSSSVSGVATASAEPAIVADDASAKAALCRPKGDDSVRDCDSEVRGISQRDLHARYGKPDNESEFMAANGVGEMRVEILNDYPPSDPASGTTRILEHTWKGDGFTFVLFLHEKNDRWEGLQAVSFVDGVEF